MVDKIIVTPESIRCLGNIIIPKSSSDFEKYKSVLSSDTETINGIERTVYTFDFDNSTFLLEVVSTHPTCVREGESIQMRVTLTDHNGNPIENANIELYTVVE